MSGTLTQPRDDLRSKLEQVESEIADLHARRAVASKEATEAKARFAASPRLDTKSAEYREAQAKVDRLREVDDALDDARDVQNGILRMISGDTPAGRSKAALAGLDMKTPGAWLARVATKAITTDDVGTTSDLSGAFIDRLTTASALLQSDVTVLDIDTTSITLPKIGAMAPADVVAELDPIPERSPDLTNVEITPPKVAVLDVVSLEAMRDGRVQVLAAHERELVRSVAAGFDDLSWNAAGADPGGPGILQTSGVLSVDAAGALTNLDPFAEAIAALVAVGAEPSAVYMNPTTWGRLSQLKKSSDSNEPLVSAALSATGRPARAILGVPAYLSGPMPADQAVVAQASEITVVRRQDVQVDVDQHYRFGSAGCGVRVIFRAQTFIAAAPGVCLIDNLPAA